MQTREPANPALTKYAQVGRLLTGEMALDDQKARDALIALLADWSDTLQLDRLGAYGIAESDFPHIVANARGSSMQTNPIVLTDGEIEEILARRV